MENPYTIKHKTVAAVCLLFIVIIGMSGCGTSDKEYTSDMNDIIDRVEKKQLRILFGQDSSLMGQVNNDPLLVDVFSYSILGDMNQIEKTITNINRIANDTSDLIAIMNKLSPPKRYQDYHDYYLRVLEKYKDSLEDKHNFYTTTKFEASSLKESLSIGSVYAQMRSVDLHNENEKHNNMIQSSLRELKSATTEFKTLLETKK